MMSTSSVPPQYAITPKKFRIKFWSIPYENAPPVDTLSAKKLTSSEANCFRKS